MLCCGKSDIGRKRSENQDFFLTKEYAPEVLLAVVCDGMGGVNGGREASRLAADSFVASLDPFVKAALAEDSLTVTAYEITAALADAVAAANETVLARTREDTSLRGMGTTLVAVLIAREAVYTVNVGDSRLYRIAGDRAEQITRDHSLVQYLMDIGKMTPEEAAHSANRNIITKAVGIDVSVEADQMRLEIEPGAEPAFLLLCSDGLSNLVTPEEMVSVLRLPSGGEGGELWLEGRAAELIRLANAGGGPDNITVVLIAV